MDTKDDNHMERMKMGVQTKQTMDIDFSTRLSDETHQHLTISEEPSSSCRKVRVRSRPRLQTTKSFPPYNHCISGLGKEGQWDSEINPKSSIIWQQHCRHDEMNDRHGVLQGTERKEDVELTARHEVKAKWRMRIKERLDGSDQVDTDECERGRWSGKRRVEETGREREHDGKGREGCKNTKWKHWNGRNLSFKTDRKEKEDEEKKKSSISAVEGECDGSGETTDATEGLMRMRGSSTAHLQSTPHPILSKLLHSSSSTSSCSSINLSSSESDEVFSEKDDVGKKRKAFRKCRSWKTYLTMVNWSLRRQGSWVQLGGHQGNFQLSERGEVLKLYSELEAKCLDCLMRDPLRSFVPQYHGLVTRGEHRYIRLEDLLSGLRGPVIMDCKMGVRTYQVEELTKAQTKATLRSDMYQKMVKIDPSAPSEEEHAKKGVTKWRYLQWRDTNSSTATLGFRIEGIMMDGSVQRDFRQIRTLSQVTEALLYFTGSQLDILKAYHSRLLDLSDALMNSTFFRTHEMIGSSLLFVHDQSCKASVWMIDFGKTTLVPDTSELQHDVPWAEGSREDGYLIGLTSLITSLSEAISVASRTAVVETPLKQFSNSG
ncbi:inositol-trisphosphate 3-kinase A-like [Mastacembelus armatus]|uniref:inositol-trisphosphate 3-kinase A-like n=1 Tax=Mastacembelus armatus TaxID=205130 RepID=UPI000E45E2B3|nr:inositol-trisphosphate 3-kinase A-like [Mastacembelus armatus]